MTTHSARQRRLSSVSTPTMVTAKSTRTLIPTSRRTIRRGILGRLVVLTFTTYCWTLAISSSVPTISAESATKGATAIVTAATTTAAAVPLLARQLEIGDFSSINQVLAGTTFELPPKSGTKDSTTLRLTDIVCRNVNVGDVEVEYTESDNLSGGAPLEVLVQVIDLDLVCEAHYEYDGRLMSGQGNVQVTSLDNHVTVRGNVSTTTTNSVQSTIQLNSCSPSVNINDVVFDDGGFLAWVLNLVEGLARGLMENMVQDMLCQELQQALENAQEVLDQVNGRFNQYAVDFSVDPLQAENDFLLEINDQADGDDAITMESLLDFSRPQTKLGQWVHKVLRQGIDYLSATVPDPAPITADSSTDLQANILMRQSLLNADRALVLLDTSLPAGGSSSSSNNSIIGGGGDKPVTLFYNHDKLLETTIQLHRVQLLGLDTLQLVEPLAVIGQYTLQGNLSWEYLAVEVNATVDIRPSSLDDAVVTGEDGLVENMQIVLGLGNVQATMALLAAINQQVLESLKLGSLLSTANIRPCWMSTIVQLNVSSLSIQAGDIYSPYLSGLDSVGLDRILNKLVEIVYLLYEDVALQRSPAFFQRDVRSTLNQDYLQEYLTTAPTSCPLPTSVSDAAATVTTATATNAPPGLVDFRDLLLSPADASLRGGRGTEPYGDLFSSLITPNLANHIGTAEQFNERVVRPATKAQSGVVGSLKWPNWLVGVEYSSSSTSDKATTGNVQHYTTTSPLYDSAVFHVSNLRIHNLDSLIDPLHFLDPQDWNTLYQTLTLHRDDLPLNVSASILFAIEGNDSPLAMNNQWDLTLTIPSISVAVGILAHMQEANLLWFPLVDATNPYCWLSALTTFTMDDGDTSSSGKGTILAPLVLETLSLSLGDSNKTFFELDSKCISCTSPGAQFLSELVRDDLPRYGFTETFAPRIVALVEDIAWQLVEGFDFESLMTKAAILCPHQTSNAGGTTKGGIGYAMELAAQLEQQLQHGSPGGKLRNTNPTVETMRGLSNTSVETTLGLGVVVVHAAMAMVARNHILLVEEGTLEAPSMTRNRTQEVSFETNSVVDWTNLSAGLGEWADFAFEELRKYIMAPVQPSRRLLEPVGTVLRQNAEQVFDEPSIPRLVSLVRENLDADGAYILDLDSDSATLTAFDVELVTSQIKVKGLDTLSEIDVMNPIQPQVVQNRFHLEELTLIIDATLNMGHKTEAIQVTYSAKNVSAQLDLLVAINLDSIRAIQIGSLFNSSHILSCMALGLQDVQIHQLSTTIEALEGPQLSGFLTSDFQTSIDSIINSMSQEYQDTIMSAMPIILDSTFRDFINAMLPGLIESFGSACSAPPNYASEGLVDFRDLLLPASASRALGGSGTNAYGDIFQVLYEILEENVIRTGAANRPVINDLLRHITNEQSTVNGTFAVEENAFDIQNKFKIAGLEAEFGFHIFNVTLENVDSVGDPLEILGPVKGQAQIINNIFSFGVDSRPFRLTGTFILSLSDGVEMNIRNEFRVVLALEDVVLMAELLLKISEQLFANFPIRDLKNVNCWLATILSQPSDNGVATGGIGLEKHSFSIGNFSLGINCEDCTSPDFDKLLLSLYDFENVTVLEDTIQDHINAVVDTDTFPVLMDQLVKRSSKRCPHNLNYDPDVARLSFLSSPAGSAGFLEMTASSEKTVHFNIVITIIATFLILFGIMAACVIKRRNRKWVASLSREGALLLECQQEKDRKMQTMLDESTQSLFASHSISSRIRYGVPVAIFLNIALFMGGHLGTLSVVNVEASVAGEEFTLYKFLEFKFFDSTVNTYNNGGAEMVVLLWIFTGIWPYVKLLLSLFLWMVPPSRLNVYRRGQALLWIDSLAKLSVIDIFTMLLGFALLLVFIGGQDESFRSSSAALYSFKAIIVPHAGFYCLIIAQRMSRVSSRFLLEQHDRVIEAATKQASWSQAKLLASCEGDCTGPVQLRDNSLVFVDQPLARSAHYDHSSSSGNTMQRVDEVAARVSEEDGRSTASFDNRPDDCQLSEELGINESPHAKGSTAYRVDNSAGNSGIEYQWGTMGVVFAAITIVIIFVIGCILAPAISLDTSTLTGLAMESGMTYEDVVHEYGVFLVISSVLLKASFVLDSKANYVGLGFLLVAALVSIAFVFFVQAYNFIKRKIKERRVGSVSPSYGHRGCGLPLYFRLHKWKHMEIYFISVTIGVWQLGSACSYAIYVYCDILRQAFSLMSLMGLTEDTDAQCSRIQATLPGNLIIIGASSLMLLLAFFFQAAAQCKKNIIDSLRFVDDDDVPRLSLAWSRDKSKNSAYSHLTASLSLDQLSEDLYPSTPCTTGASTPTGTPKSNEIESTDDSDSTPSTGLLRSPVYSTPSRVASSHRGTICSVRFHASNRDEGCDPPSPPGVHTREMPSIAADDGKFFTVGYRFSDENAD